MHAQLASELARAPFAHLRVVREVNGLVGKRQRFDHAVVEVDLVRAPVSRSSGSGARRAPDKPYKIRV